MGQQRLDPLLISVFRRDTGGRISGKKKGKPSGLPVMKNTS
jgi:hypothetical protein